jgi:plasmid stability protein
MAQMLIRQLEDDEVVRLKRHAAERRMSSEALARDAIRKLAAELTREEKVKLAREMQARMRAAFVPGVAQTPGVELIRRSRDVDH